MDGPVREHDKGLQARSTRAAELTLQAVPLDRPAPLRPLYWRNPDGDAGNAGRSELDGRGALTIPIGTIVSFDTYFGAFFEYQWRLYTHLRTLTLRLTVEGEGWLRVWRRTPHAGKALLGEQQVTGAVSLALPSATAHFRESGLIWFDLVALGQPVVLVSACWTTRDSPAAPVGLGVAICTFNREPELSGVLARIADHAALDPALARVIVVNQGRPGLLSVPSIALEAARLAHRLLVLEQANLGGAGGFSRGLVAALDDPAISHVCFLDDDVALEADCLLRMAAFFALAREDVALGGHMLDALQPTTLYEAGAVMLENWALQPLNCGLDLRDPMALDRLLDSASMHYNGWWMFGFPKRLVARVGMPLPCFIRGDDVEFGMRLHGHGIMTVPLPGVGIWHEPFYVKIGGWQLYYETRNALVCAALHRDFTPHRVAIRMAKTLLIQLLTYRYYSTALIVRGIEDFLLGPEILDQDPRPLHAGLAALKDLYPQAWTRRETVLAIAPVGRSPAWLPGFLFAMAWALTRNWLRQTRPAAPPTWLDVQNQVWFRVMRTENLAVETHWDAELPTFRRDRASFRLLFVAGARAVWRLYRTAPAVQRRFKEAAPALTSVSSWRRYLDLPPRSP